MPDDTHIEFTIRATGTIRLPLADMEPGDPEKFAEGRLEAADLISEYRSAQDQWENLSDLEIEDWYTFTPKPKPVES